ncbi:MAG: alcohol dehydrogenase catalytic domain-containing protein [Euryarchaeota archaeon]|nr:alcohol dehydrogenase catalytic domain-containing protein [Euryarchaeota archaeon]
MRAVVCHDFGAWSVEDVDRPTPDANEVLLEIHRVQLSVTECALFQGESIAHAESVAARLAEGPARLFGHEFCGTVVERGENVDHLAVGDRVYAPGKIPCGECSYCESGFKRYCPSKTYIGYDIPGALAEYTALPAEALRPVADSLSDAEVAALQPLASSVLCVRDSGIQSGDIVAVIGTGVMGYQCAQLALAEGAERVFVTDVDPKKLDIAAERGLDPIDATGCDPVEEITAHTNGVGADVVFEAVGGDQSHATDGSDPIAQAMGAVKAGGTVVQVGYIIGDVTFSARAVRKKSVTWQNPVTGIAPTGPGRDTGDFAAELVASGRVSISEYVTHERSGLDSFAEAVDITANKADYGAHGPAQIVVDSHTNL